MTTDNISIFPHAFKRERKNNIHRKIKIANKICIKKYWYKGDEGNDDDNDND